MFTYTEPALSGLFRTVTDQGGLVLRSFLYRQRIWLGVMLLLLTTLPSPAQEKPNEKLLLENFIHYVIIGKPDLAASNGQVLLDSVESDKQLADLLDSLRDPERFHKAIKLSLKQDVSEQLLKVAGELEKRTEAGIRSRAREPQRIKEAIEMLLGGQRSVALGRERLVEAGEYAVPQMLDAMMNRGSGILKAELMQTFRQLGGRCVTPLSEALPSLDPELQQRLAGLLGEIGYPNALPALQEVWLETNNEAVKDAVERAVRAINGRFDSTASLAGLQADMADRYYQKDRSLLSFPGEAYQLVWSYSPQQGLTPQAVRTEIYFPVMAMRGYKRSLQADPNFRTALSGWILANFAREVNMPVDYSDPTYGPEMRSPMYYAVASGPASVQPVLGRALKDRSTPIARRAIAALAQTGGGSSLWRSDLGSQPLVDALTYPDRRVRADAALALAAAMPTEPFGGSDRVVPELASAIRATGVNYAMVICDDPEIRLELASLARKMGFTMLSPVASFNDVKNELTETPGVDLVIMSLPASEMEKQYQELRTEYRLTAAPVIMFTSTHDREYLDNMFGRDVTTSIVRLNIPDDKRVEAINSLLNLAAGGLLTDEESKDYALRALTALHDLAVSRSTVFNVSDAARQLISALSDTTGEVRLSIAGVLSYIDQKRVQVSLMDAAMNADGEEQINLLHDVAGSARRFGNLLEDRQVEELLRLVRTSRGDLATAAAATAGALNLSPEYVVPLIVGEKQ